ncbi:MAG: hypothetical protein EOP48_27650, partial [Sphingobacteriales bacterium]
EYDPEVYGEGNEQDYGMRIYDPRIGKFLSVDPISKEYPWYTPYHFAGNSPMLNVDLDGLENAPTQPNTSPLNPDERFMKVRDEFRKAFDYVKDAAKIVKIDRFFDIAVSTASLAANQVLSRTNAQYQSTLKKLNGLTKELNTLDAGSAKTQKQQQNSNVGGLAGYGGGNGVGAGSNGNWGPPVVGRPLTPLDKERSKVAKKIEALKEEIYELENKRMEWERIRDGLADLSPLSKTRDEIDAFIKVVKDPTYEKVRDYLVDKLIDLVKGELVDEANKKSPKKSTH